MTGIGPVAVRQPRVRDRDATEGARIRYSPSILPRYARRSQSLEVLIPILYLNGIHLEARLEEQAQCILVIIGATPEGKKELRFFADRAAKKWPLRGSLKLG